LIEEKVVKEEEKVLKDWPKEGIRIEKARWGRFHLLKGKTKIELPKNTEVEKITLEEAKAMLDKKAPASKKTIAKKKAPLKKKIAPKSTKKK